MSRKFLKVTHFQQTQMIMRPGTPLPHFEWVGLHIDLCLLGQITSTQEVLQGSQAAA